MEIVNLVGKIPGINALMVERRNLGFMEKNISMAKLLNSFTVRKRWCRKFVVRDFAPCHKISMFFQ